MNSLTGHNLNPLHPRADGDAVAAGFKKRFPFSFSNLVPRRPMSFVTNQQDIIEAIQKETIRLIDQQMSLLTELQQAEVKFGPETEALGKDPYDVLRAIWSSERAKVENLTMTIAVVGTLNAGKSSVLNAIMGEEILPSRNTAMTAIPIVIQNAPALRDPVLLLKDVHLLNEAAAKLRIHMQKVMVQEGNGTMGAPADAVEQSDSSAIPEELQGDHNWSFGAETCGAQRIRQCLRVLNDLSRLCALYELPLNWPAREAGTYEDFPQLRVAFSQSMMSGIQFGVGNLAFIDTPGPNEARQTYLEELVQMQLAHASGIMLVLDYTQLKARADDELRGQVRDVTRDWPERVHLVVNKFDQRDANSMDECKLKRYVEAELWSKAKSGASRVFPVSARRALLATRILNCLDREGRLPDSAEAGWVEDFGREALGTRWQQRINDTLQVRDAATDILEESNFSRLMETVVGHAFRNAGTECLRSALRKMVGQNGFLSLAKTAITSAVASLMLTIDEIARAISALEEFLGRYEKASLEVPKVVDEEMAAFDTIVETEKTALMTRIQGGDSAEQGITVRTTETIESEFISWRKVWAWIKQIGKEAKNPEADKRELEERTQSAISQLEECARRECEAFRERVNYHATNHLPRISSRINQLFEALRTAATNFEKWSQIELSIPPFDFDGHGVGGLDYKNFIKHETVVTKEEQAAHRIDFKLLWLIPIKFFPYKKIISTNKDVLTLDVNKLREELELRVQSLTNGASTGFKEQLTTSTNDYKSAIGQHLHIAKDNLKTDRQKEQADYEKKQERVPLLNQLGTRRTELHEQARQVLTGIGATSEVHS